jgi:hypothetical protein
MKEGTATLNNSQKPPRKFVIPAEIYQERLNDFLKNNSNNDVLRERKDR